MPTPSLEELAGYLPRLQQRYLNLRGGIPDAPVSVSQPAAILFVDVVGFTALTERLARRGAIGPELLSELMSASFGRMTDIVTDHGGDVLAFAGDAAIVAWPVDSCDELADAACLAAQSGLEVQRRLSGFEPIAGIRLALRACVGAGAMGFMELGGAFGRWLFLAAGDAISQVTEADREARAGDVVLAAAAFELVESRVTAEPLGSGAARLRAVRRPARVLPPAPARLGEHLRPALRSYLPEVIRQRFDAGQEAWLAELRLLTLLFVSLRGVAVDEPRLARRLQPAVTTMQRGLARYEGHVYQLLMDDKGLTLVAAFGLPPLAHEDDAPRAVKAALDLREDLAARDVSCALGLATGRAFCGEYRTRARRQYTIAGAVINRAARLMQAADGGVLCDLPTAVRARDARDLECVERGAVAAKGIAGRTRVFSPRYAAGAQPGVPPRAAGSPRQELFGRTAERRGLDDGLAALLAGRGAAVVIEGEAGIGKSRLAEYLVAGARRQGARVLAGSGDAVETDTPYQAWKTVFEHFFAPADGARGVRERLAALPELAPLGPLLAAVLPWELPDTRRTETLTGQARAQATRRLLWRLLEDAAGTPTVVLLEDGHWLDSASWALLDMAAPARPPFLLVLTTRPLETAPEAYRRLLAAPHCRHLALKELTHDDIGRVIGESLGVDEVPRAVVDRIYEHTDGNPFFSQEVAFALRDAGQLAVDGGACRLSKGGSNAPLVLPPTVEGVVTSRLDRLPSGPQLTVKVASVIGRRFSRETLRAIYPVAVTAGEIEDHLDRLIDLDLLRSTASGSKIGFRHALTHGVIYESLLFAQRRGLHRAIAEGYERSEQAKSYPLLAHHWRRADVADKTVRYLGLAGEEALRTYANEEAVRFLKEALELSVEDTGDSAERRRREGRFELLIGRAHVNLLQHLAGRPHLERGLALERVAIPVRSAALTLGLLRQAWVQVLHRLRPQRYVGRLARQRERVLEQARAYEGLVEAYYLEDARLSCLYAALRSLNLAELAGPCGELARGYASIGSILGFVPAHHLADAYCTRADRTARQVGDTSARGWVALATGVYKVGLGRFREATELFQETVGLAEEAGDRRRLEDGVMSLSAVSYLRGDLEKSLELADRLYATVQEDEHARYYRGASLRRRVLALLALDRVEPVAGCLDELAGLCGEPTSVAEVRLHVYLQGLRALWHWRCGDGSGATAACRAAIAHLPDYQPTSFETLFEYSYLARLGLELRRAQPTEDAIDLTLVWRSLKAYARIFPIGRPVLLLWRGLDLAISGDGRRWAARRRRGLALLRRAAAVAEELGLPFFEALAHREIARYLPSGDPERAGSLATASRLFERLGAHRELSRLRAVGEPGLDGRAS